jgi:UDP-N-acetylmuramate--alanine ligase
MSMNKGNNIYFLGIGGIGMSALARFYHSRGYMVSGYDLTPTPLTRQLDLEGMPISYTDAPDNLPFMPDWVVYTPAIPKNNSLYQHFKQAGIPMKKRAQVLGEISQDFYTIAVAGTHGKTTITSMVAHILKHNSKPITAFVGGICNNYNSNLILSPDTEIVVVEADEFDRSFLTLYPDLAIISSMDADHLDIYGSKDYLEESFQLFAEQIKKNGCLYHKNGLSIKPIKGVERFAYSTREKAHVWTDNSSYSQGRNVFDIHLEDGSVVKANTFLPGAHNRANMAAAAAVCRKAGLNSQEIESGINSYTGVKRRFDVRIHREDLVYIDDYAHHPEEIRATLQAVKELHPGKRITVIFQPHLFSRTKDFADDFAASLSQVDQLFLMPIYPARELPMAGVSSEWLLEKVNTQKEMCDFDTVVEQVVQSQPEILLSLGAGSIDRIVEPLEKALS